MQSRISLIETGLYLGTLSISLNLVSILPGRQNLYETAMLKTYFLETVSSMLSTLRTSLDVSSGNDCSC